MARSLLNVIGAVSMWALAIYLERSAQSSIDPFAMVCRALAYVLSLRSVFVLHELIQRVQLWRTRKEYCITLSPTQITLDFPEGQHVIDREAVVDICDPGDWGTRSPRRFTPVYLIGRPHAGRALWSLPPIFEGGPGRLAERLMRWRGPVEAGEPTFPSPRELGSKTYDAATRGQVPAGGAVVHHGNGWLRRGPYAAAVVGVVFIDGLFRNSDPQLLEALGVLPWLMLAICVAVPIVWIALTRRHVAPRKGLAFVATPAEILMRTRAGVVRTRWAKLDDVRIASRPGWSVLGGYQPTRHLVFERPGQPPIRYDEAYLGIHVEVAAALANAFRRGLMAEPTKALDRSR